MTKDDRSDDFFFGDVRKFTIDSSHHQKNLNLLVLAFVPSSGNYLHAVMPVTWELACLKCGAAFRGGYPCVIDGIQAMSHLTRRCVFFCVGYKQIRWRMFHAFRVAKLGDMAGYTTILAGNSVRFMVSLAGFYFHGI